MKIIIALFLSIGFFSFCKAQNNQINITSFNVNGTDQKDDTHNFDIAVEYIAMRGGILYVPAGEYILDQKMRKRSGVNNNSYIFLAQKDFIIKMHKDARLIFKNAFQGFRFRSTYDPNENSLHKLNISIQGGIVDGSLNNNYHKINNPQIWAFVGEYLNSFKVTNLFIRNIAGTAGIASYNNKAFSAQNNILINVSGNHNDYVDNHGDGIYISNTHTYHVEKNIILNTNKRSDRLGRIGICLEYESTNNGQIYANTIRGYDRGIHVELIKGTAVISNNVLEGNLSGIVLWNNYKFKQIIANNDISNIGLESNIQPILYTNAPILLLGYDLNRGTEIINNKISIYNEYFIPKHLIQITSSEMKILGNTIKDFSNTLSLSVSQGKSANERIYNIQFIDNKLLSKSLLAYDGSQLFIENNELEIEEIILSLDNTNNTYRGNVVKGNINGKQPKVRLYGKYK